MKKIISLTTKLRLKNYICLGLLILFCLPNLYAIDYQAITKCSKIGNDTERLSCYDQAIKSEAKKEFVFSNISYKQRSYGETTDFIGEITNNTDEFQSYVSVNILVYDANGKLIGKGYFNIANLSPGQTKGFGASIYDTPSHVIKSYKFQVN